MASNQQQKQRARRPAGGNKVQYRSASLCGASSSSSAASGAASGASFTPNEIGRIETLLRRKLDVGDVKQRKGQGGSTLTYIESWRAIDKANEVFGVNGWRCEIKCLGVDFSRQPVRALCRPG